MKDNSVNLILWIALTALTVSLLLVPVGFAFSIGVKEGDWAKYQVEVSLQEWEEDEEFIDWELLKFEVKSVSDEIVSLEVTVHFKNGTEETDTIPDAMEEGLLLPADYGKDDEVEFPFFGGGGFYLNGTVSRTYADITREVNYVDVSVDEDFISSTMKAYWDKKTGILCEMDLSISFEFLEETSEMSLSFMMIETNMFTSASITGQWWFYPAIIGIVIVVVVGIVVYKRGGR